MKNVLSILLSFGLLLTSVPMAEQVELRNQWMSAAEEKRQTKVFIAEEELEISQEETESRKENAAGGQEDKQEQEDKKALGETAVQKEKNEKRAINSKNKTKKMKPAEKKLVQKRDEEGTEIMEPKEPVEAAAESRAAGADFVTVQQDKESKCLRLLEGETVYPGNKEGYHAAVSRKINCRHTSLGYRTGSIKCERSGSPLNPTKEELKNNVKLTGMLRGKTIKRKKFTAYNPGGKDNTVTHLNLDVEIEVPGEDGTNLTGLVAGPYVCEGDGHAGYAYTERHFSYCPNTERYYYVASSHVWLGCTKDRDGGNNEFHDTECNHQFSLYKYVPNSYKVRYDANGGDGMVAGQNATYDKTFALRPGNGFKFAGHTLTGWNTRKDGTGQAYGLGVNVKNLTKENGGIIMLYAQWRPNWLTVRYHANGGTADLWNAVQSIGFYYDSWPYGNVKKIPADFSLFGLSRVGYSRKEGAEWNTNPNGTGKSFDQKVGYLVTDYSPGLTTADQDVTLYAQWEPNVYTVKLDNRLDSPDKAGTAKIYKKYTKGIYLDSTCRQEAAQIILPQKVGYQFQGYYSQSGKLMVNYDGNLTAEAENRKGEIGDEIWTARYHYLIGCEDYADIPCDFEKISDDAREDLGLKLTYDVSAREVHVHTGQLWCSISLTAQPQGTQIGEIKSSPAVGSITGNTGLLPGMRLSLNVTEGAAYQLTVKKDGRTLCDRLVYYKDGRFRTLVKLGDQEAKVKEPGSSIAGSTWNKEGQGDYSLYRYQGCSEMKDIQRPGTVCRYFRYKDVNMAYSGAGATWGNNMLEYDVSLEDMYQFRDHEFRKEKTETKYTVNHKPYQCQVKYSFRGWEMASCSSGQDMDKENTYTEKQQEGAVSVYAKAKHIGAVSDRTTEDIDTYQITEPIRVLPGFAGDVRAAQGSWDGAVKVPDSPQTHAIDFINLMAKWDSCPTITVTPGEKLEFYEGEEVAKEDLTSRLTTHDKEDNRDMKANPDLNDKLRIVKISYPESRNHSQTAYEKVYEEDVPPDFLLDTYYLKLEENESVEALVTFAVTDSAGNTTNEQIPVKVKYNHYPRISSEDVFYYLKEEANQGKITAEELIGRALAEDEEDGDITRKLELKDFAPQELMLQIESKAEFPVTYQVTDAYRKTSYKTVKVVVWDEDAAIAELPQYYVRYISRKYLDTLEENSVWREPENMAYLKNVLENEKPMETWKYTHEDILAVQKWITEGGKWKIGQAANQAFLVKFAYCRK